ncbi:MAG: DUF1330 domain-containing protein [Sinobacteraceae bacterium]|nr:DUF1330 domain-containing protein [Nevskiaceae bacterium]
MLVRLILCLVGSLGVATTLPAQSTGDPNTPRPGYLLVMGTSTDAAAMGRYARTLPPIYAKLDGYYLALGAVGRGITVLEGSFKAQSVVLAKFPRIEGPNEFWWSPEYRRSVEIRRGAGSFTVVKLKGVPGDLDKPSGKPAYLLSIGDIKDRDKLKPYADIARPLVRAAGASFVSVGGRKDIELLEGEFGNLDVTLLRFPSMQALETFYRDPAYQRAIPLRQSAGEYTLLAIEGIANE